VVTSELMSLAAPGAVVMHAALTTLEPVLSAEVYDGPRSVASEQARNLLGVERAVLRALVTGDWEV
jgi:ornithine carbamoyltransferase